MVRNIFWAASLATLVGIGLLASRWPRAWLLLLLVLPIIARGAYDIVQTRHAILRNFPIVGHFRYLLEQVRPEIVQYFIEQNHDGRPLDREQRSIIYQRAKRELDTLPFGTQRDVYEVGY